MGLVWPVPNIRWDDWIMGQDDPYVSDFIWSMDDSRCVESVAPEISESQVDMLHLAEPGGPKALLVFPSPELFTP